MEVVREVVLPGPPEEIWEALTEAEQLEEWFANHVDFDLERGGGDFRWDDGERRRAVVADSEPGRRLALEWWDPDVAGSETSVVFTLEPVREGTRLVVTESQTGPQACAGEWAWALSLHVHALHVPTPHVHGRSLLGAR